MPRPLGYGASQSEARFGWRAWLVLSTVAVVFLSLGIETLWRHAQNREASLYRAPSGVALVLLAFLQLLVVARLGRRGDAVEAQRLYLRPAFWRWMFAGAVLSYAAVLCLGEPGDVRYLFRAAVAAWYTLSLVPLIAPRGFERFAAHLPERFVLRTAARVAFYVLALLVSFEATLRVHALMTGQRAAAAFVAHRLRLPPGAELGGQTVNRQGYWDDDFQRDSRPGVFRIAVLGDAVTLSGTHETNYLKQIEQSMPGVEMLHFGLPNAGPREYAAQLVHDVVRYQPGLVLVFLSVEDDITEEVPLPSTFEWEGLRLYQSIAWSLAGSPSAQEPAKPTTGRSAGQQRADQGLATIAVCRTPLDDAMRARWDRSLGHVSDLIEQCAARELPCALVIVPGRFQVSQSFCASLARRAGCQPHELDLELPQRRLADFAHAQEVALFDLLPYLRRERQSLYSAEDDSWNVAGQTAVADALRGWLTSQFGGMMSVHAQASAR